MGFFSNLTGGRSRDDIAYANAQAKKYLETGLTGAESAFNTARDRQLNAMLQGRDASVSSLNSGYDRANQTLQDYYGQASGQLNQGYDAAINASNDYLQRTQNVLNPYIEQGQQAQGLYGQAIGLDGAEAQKQFLDNYATSDPFRQHNEDMANKAMLRAANASGRKFSGQTDLAMARASLDRGSEDYNNYLNRLQQQSNQGSQFAGALAGYTHNTGQQIAGYEAGRGTGQANLSTGLGQGLAGNAVNQGTSLANIYTNYGNNVANVHGQHGNNVAGMRYGHGQQLANNAIQAGNATAQTRSTGLNNMLGAIGTGLQAFGTFRSGMMI